MEPSLKRVSDSMLLKAACSRSPSSSSSSSSSPCCSLHRRRAGGVSFFTHERKYQQKPHLAVVARKSTKFEDVSQCFEEECGITKQKEVEVVVDILTNPASGYIDRKLASKYRSFQLKELGKSKRLKLWIRTF